MEIKNRYIMYFDVVYILKSRFLKGYHLNIISFIRSQTLNRVKIRILYYQHPTSYEAGET